MITFYVLNSKNLDIDEKEGFYCSLAKKPKITRKDS